MNNRPALKLDISGRVHRLTTAGPEATSIERKVKAQKMKELVRQGTAPQPVEDVEVDKANTSATSRQCTATKACLNRETSSALLKTLPVREMESLMLKNAQATDDELRNLANPRAQRFQNRSPATDRSPPIGSPSGCEAGFLGRRRRSQTEPG